MFVLLAAAAFVAVAQPGDALAAPPLIEMRGRALATSRGVTVLSFIYTRCADARMCPLVTAKYGRMARLLADAPVRLVEVTLDPAYDTPSVLRRYGAAAGADGERWTLATGEPTAIARFAERAGIVVDRPRPGLVIHTEAVVIARDGIIETIVPGNDWTAAEIAAEARSVAALPADPLQRLALRAFGGLARWCGRAAAGGITPAAGALIFLALASASLLTARRLVRAIVAGR